MAGGLGYVRPGWKYPRAFYQALIDSLFQSPHGAANIAYRRESTQQHRSGRSYGLRTDITPGFLVDGFCRGIVQHKMHMRIGKPWHQGKSAAIDHSRMTFRLDLTGRNRLDQIPFDQYLVIFVESVLGAVEDVDVLDQYLRWFVIGHGNRWKTKTNQGY